MIDYRMDTFLQFLQAYMTFVNVFLKYINYYKGEPFQNSHICKNNIYHFFENKTSILSWKIDLQ